MMRNAEIWFDAGELNTGELVTFNKHCLSAEPDTASQRAEFHSKQIYLFWKGVHKAECGASMLLAVNFLAESLLARSKVTSPVPSFMLGLNHQRVAAALCWYCSKEMSKRLPRAPEPCCAPACMARTVAKLPASGWLCAGMPLRLRQDPLGVICHLPICASFSLLVLHQAGWAGSSPVKGISSCCCASCKQQELCPNCVAEWWWQGCCSGNWRERHKILVGFASDLCSRWVAPCFIGRKSQVA